DDAVDDVLVEEPVEPGHKAGERRGAVDDAVDDVLIEERADARQQQGPVDEDGLIDLIEVPLAVEQTIQRPAGEIGEELGRERFAAIHEVSDDYAESRHG